MLKIKLARFGKRNQPHYRIVVNEARDKRDGSYVANLGHYAPSQQPKLLEVNLEQYEAWVKKGAQPTKTVEHLVKRYSSGEPFPERPAKPSKKARAKAKAKAQEQTKDQTKDQERDKEPTKAESTSGSQTQNQNQPDKIDATQSTAPDAAA